MNGRWALFGAMGCLVPELLVRNGVSCKPAEWPYVAPANNHTHASQAWVSSVAAEV
jgi:hypothetical protein